MRGSNYNSSVGIRYIGNLKVFIRTLTNITLEVSVDIRMHSVTALYCAMLTGSYVPVVSFVRYPVRSVELMFVTVIVGTNVTEDITVLVNVVTLVLCGEVTSAGGNEPVLFGIGVYPFVRMGTYLEVAYVAVAVTRFIYMSSLIGGVNVMIAGGIVPVVFGVIVPICIGGVFAELVAASVTDTVVVGIVVQRNVDLL